MKSGGLRFRDFVEAALYHPHFGYYARAANPVGKGGDYVTAPGLSPAFAYALGNLVREFVRRCEGGVCSIVDIGCGEGQLIRDVARQFPRHFADFYGVDRSLKRSVAPEREEEAPAVKFVNTLDELPWRGAQLLLSNELFDAFPFARLVRRGSGLHELWVTEREGSLDWDEREAGDEYQEYFDQHGIALDQGQFADVSLEWAAYYGEMVRRVERGLIVTIDYGFPAPSLFHPRARRYGTAAAYSGQRVSRDLLARPGEQDLTAHINFTDLQRAGETHGAATLYFDRLAKFLLAAGITSHPLFRPLEENLSFASPEEGLAFREAREEARRLVLPDGIGEEMRVLVQVKGMAGEGWAFQQPLF